jgi:hypothetical protein
MTSHSSSTIAATSDVTSRVTAALREKVESQSTEQAARISRVVVRIKDLEARGFIKRQQFSAPTTGDFERKLLCKNG